MASEDFAAAAAELARRDPEMARTIETAGPPDIRPPQENGFGALVRAITFQQLAGRAASAIHGRFLAAMPDGLTPEAVLALPETAFRAAGLSGAKTASIRDLAAKVADGAVPLGDVDGLPDDEIVERLSSVRGIGRWTAEMFLIFQLRRPDVWPVDDLGIRKGYALIHRLPEPPKPKQLQLLGDAYRPYRTVAAWYCWRAAATIVPD
jgi:DNA-3-methyladenine glycosylase II